MFEYFLVYSGIRNSLKPADKCDLLKCLILGLCVYFFSFIDTSVIYHVIKSQSVIKLYIFFNMLEVGDRLFASFVQDTLGECSDFKGVVEFLTRFLIDFNVIFVYQMLSFLRRPSYQKRKVEWERPHTRYWPSSVSLVMPSSFYSKQQP